MKSLRFIMAPRQTGFTLVELMVGMAIGLFLVLVITQVMGIFESRNRATMGNADAQTNGGIALYTIGRDLQMAGYSLLPEASSGLECTALTISVAGITDITPIAITDGVASAGVSASDTLTVRYGSSMKGGVMTPITANPPYTSNDVPVKSNTGCQLNDAALVVDGSVCYLRSVAGPADIGKYDSTNFTTIKLDNTTGAKSNANIACLGGWSQITYAVSNGNLARNGAPMLSGVVNMQAQYGITATANSNQITQWVDAAGATWAAPNLANRNRIKAVRLAVVARNDKMDITNVSSACSSTTTASPTGLCAWEGTATSPAPAIDLSPGDANWQRYRYRVFETIIPLRNVIWSKDTL